MRDDEDAGAPLACSEIPLEGDAAEPVDAPTDEEGVMLLAAEATLEDASMEDDVDAEETCSDVACDADDVSADEADDHDEALADDVDMTIEEDASIDVLDALASDVICDDDAARDEASDEEARDDASDCDGVEVATPLPDTC